MSRLAVCALSILVLFAPETLAQVVGQGAERARPVRAPHPQQILLQRADEALRDPGVSSMVVEDRPEYRVLRDYCEPGHEDKGWPRDGWPSLPTLEWSRRAPSARARDPRAARPGGRAPASTAAPAPSRCAAPQPATSPTLFGSPRHETARLRAPDERGPPGRHPGRRRPDRGDDTAPGTGSPDASHTRWSGRSATRGRPAARHTPDGWRSTGRHSSRRPPPGQRAAGLQGPPSHTVGLHQQLDLGLQPTTSRASVARLRPACPAARNSSATPAPP